MKSNPRTHAARIAVPVFAGLLLACIVLTAACQRPQRWNVLLVTFDTTRADHIGCYGNERIFTPNIDALAAEGVRFARAYSAIPLTTPSHSSILTGKYPLAHGVRDNGQFVLTDRHETLAEILRAEGYATAAAIGAFPLTRRFGTHQGFDMYDDHVAQTELGLLGTKMLPNVTLFFDERSAGRVNEALFPWLEAHADEPFFAWAHYFDPHQPQQPPPPYDQLYADDLYLGEIAYADESLGRLIGKLHELGVYDRTLIVFTSDHGEGLYEHDELTHSLLLYNTTLHVPLIIKTPGGSPETAVEMPVATVDILPTILDFLGLVARDGVHGRSLRPVMEESNALDATPIYAETLAPRLGYRWGELRALIQGDLKYIHGPRPELYDVVADPHELHDLVASRTRIAEGIKRELVDFIEQNAESNLDAALVVDEATRQQLMALGYLSSSVEDPSKIQETLHSGGVAPQDRVADISDFGAAKNLLIQNHPLAAREIIQRLVDRDPENPVYLELLATAHTQLGQLGEAMEILETTTSAGKISAKLLLQIGSLYFFRGEHQQAKASLQQSIAFEESATAHYLLANVFSADGDAAAEFRALEASLEADPTYAPARVDLAIRLAQRGEREAAENEFVGAIRDQPYFAKAFFNYGAFLADAGSLNEATQCFERAIVLRPAYWRAYTALVQIHLARGNREEARRQLEILIARAPGGKETEQARRLFEEPS